MAALASPLTSQAQSQLDLATRCSHTLPPTVAHRLPTELWSKIFSLTVELIRLGQYPIPHTLESPVLPISQTCQSWREISHSLPALWTDLSFTEEQCRTVLYRQLIKAWIGRARLLPLSISFFADTYTDETLTGLTCVLLPIIKQTRRLDLVISTDYLGVFNCLDSDDISILENLSIHSFLPQNRALHVNFDVALPFHKAPMLRTFDCGIFSSDDSLSISLLGSDLISVSWSSLAELSLSDKLIEASLTCEIFRQCTSLITCRLSVCGWNPDHDVSNVPPSVHLNLRSLSISVEYGLFHKFFDSIELPALEELTLQYYPSWSMSEDYRVVSYITNVHTRSMFKLKTLRLSSLALTSTNDFLDLFSCLDYLETLELRGCACLNEEVVSVMTFNGPRAFPMLPSLTTLIVDDQCQDFRHCEKVLDMVESRWWPHEAQASKVQWWDHPAGIERAAARIEAVQITLSQDSYNSYPPIKYTTLHRIRTLREQGLKLDYEIDDIALRLSQVTHRVQHGS